MTASASFRVTDTCSDDRSVIVTEADELLEDDVELPPLAADDALLDELPSVSPSATLSAVIVPPIVAVTVRFADSLAASAYSCCADARLTLSLFNAS